MIKKKFWLFLVLIPLLMSTFIRDAYGADFGAGEGNFGGASTSTQFSLPGFLEKNINYEIETNLEESVQTREMNVQTWFVGNKNRTGDGIVGVGDTITFYFLSALGGTHFFTQSSGTPNGVYLPGGAIGDATNLLTISLARPMISSTEYLADLKSSFGFSEPILAQEGMGYEALRISVLPLWKTMRNIAYLFFALIFIVIGLGIMFRVKINPQTAISIQSAIPQIIISLLLVTFSYAIAGFMFDLMYVSIGLIIGIFTAPLREISGGYVDALPLIDPNNISANVFMVLSTIGAGALGKLILMGVLFFNPIFGLILLIMILYTLIRVLILLMTTYAKIILGVVFAPLQIMLGAVPGQPGFGKWLRNLISNLAVLPTIITMILLAGLFIGLVPADGEAGITRDLAKVFEILKNILATDDLSGAIIAYWSVFAFGIEVIIGLGIFFMIPKAAEMVRDALQVKPFPYGSGFGEALGPVKPIATYPFQRDAEHLAQQDKDGLNVGTPGKMRHTAYNVLRTFGKIK